MEKTDELKLQIRQQQLATERAQFRIKATRWDFNTAIIAYAALGTAVILRMQGVGIEIVASIAVVELFLIWLVGWVRSKHLYKRYFSEELEQIRELSTERKNIIPMPNTLTSREKEILHYIACGQKNKQIAASLGISQNTVRNQLSALLRKLEVKDRTEAAVLALHNGWISVSNIESSEKREER